MSKPILVSGVQPTGRLHLGNYFGALKNFVGLQNSRKYDCYFFIADLHSLTEDFDPKEKRAQIVTLAADFLAAGLDPKKSVIFLQSQIPAHAELAWILNTLTPMSELERMTQFKDKASRPHANINVGLFDYPVLMVADIILYDAAYVPVGHDQLQHLEFTRTLARKFNIRFGKTFIEPQPVLTRTPRVMSLADPLKKMSKSDPESCLFVDDSPEEIRRKVRRAVTDSGSEIKFDKKNKPAVSNLLEIFAACAGEQTEKIEKRFADANYSTLKEELANVIIAHFAGFRARKQAFMKREKVLSSVLVAGSKQAGVRAAKKIVEVKKKVGLA